MCFTRSIVSMATYKIKNYELEWVYKHRYLGVNFSNNLKWNDHIDSVVAKASKILFFIRRNFKNTSRSVRQILYFSFIKPISEYACVIWDPPQCYLANKLERIQNQALRFVTGDYSPYSSCTEMKNRLGWDLLRLRRKCLRLKFFHSIYHGETGIEKGLYILEPHHVSSRRNHSKTAAEYRYRTDCFCYSFFVQTAREWNALPEELIAIINNDVFYDRLRRSVVE